MEVGKVEEKIGHKKWSNAWLDLVVIELFKKLTICYMQSHFDKIASYCNRKKNCFIFNSIFSNILISWKIEKKNSIKRLEPIWVSTRSIFCQIRLIQLPIKLRNNS